jgi:hypothetical protein
LYDCRSALQNFNSLKSNLHQRVTSEWRSTKTPIKASQVGSELFYGVRDRRLQGRAFNLFSGRK